MTINWRNIAECVDFWRRHGAKHIDVPWVVPIDIARMTHTGPLTYSDSGALVGSAEQSFLHLQVRGQLGPHWYVACTPCFRKEEVDELHQEQFMKVEVFVPNPQPVDLETMIERSIRFFGDRAPFCELERVTTPEGIDINLNGIEIGSYGLRNVGGYEWLYGTGIAEPRFTIASKSPRQ